MESPDKSTSSTGLTPQVAAALCYVLGFVSGAIIYVLEKDNRLVRFHAVQASILSLLWLAALWAVLPIVTGALAFVPIVGWLCAALLGLGLTLGGLCLWLYLIIRTYQGYLVSLPVIGRWAGRNSTVAN